MELISQCGQKNNIYIFHNSTFKDYSNEKPEKVTEKQTKARKSQESVLEGNYFKDQLCQMQLMGQVR